MAELVQKRLEATVFDLEELERNGIFSKAEIKSIVKKRRKFEYRLIRRPALKEDFLSAVQYELNLDMLRKHRMEKLGIKQMSEAASGIRSRIHGIFQRAVKKFNCDVDLWLEYIEFCKRVHHYVALGKALGQVLSLSPKEPSLWVTAAQNEIGVNRDFSNARILLQKGLRVNSTAQLLWLEAFRLELLYVDQLKRREDVLHIENVTVDDAVLSNKAAELVFKEAIKVIPENVAFRSECLEVLKDFDEMEHLQNLICKSLLEDCSHLPQTWTVLVQQHSRDVQLSSLTEEKAVALFKEVTETFMKGLESVDHAKAEVWSSYIDWQVEFLKELPKCSFAKEKLLQCCEEVICDDCITEELLLLAIETTSKYGSPKAVGKLCSLGVDKFPTSESIWLKRLRDCSGVTMEMFSNCLKSLPGSSAIWEYYLTWCLNNCLPNEVEQAFKSGVKHQLKNVSSVCTKMYLKWLFKTKPIKEVRTQYIQILDYHPVALETYCECIKLERERASSLHSPQDHSFQKQTRVIYQKAILEHGHADIDIWLDFLKFEVECNTAESLLNANNIYWKARKTLKKELISEFTTKHSLLRSK